MMIGLARRNLMCCAACVLVGITAPTPAGAFEPRDRIAEYAALSNDHRVDQLVELYAESARLDFGPMGVISGRDRIRGIHEYDRALETELRFEDCRYEERVAVCRTVERNRWLATAGIGKITFAESTFAFDGQGLVESVSAVLSPESAEALGAAMASFGAWATANRPEEYAALFREDGSFDYGYEVGEQVLALLREWRAASNAPWVGPPERPFFIAVRVEDVDAVVGWYRTSFGLESVDDTTAENGAWRIVNLASDQLHVEIVRDDRAKSAERPRGLFKVGFAVDDIEIVADRVESATGERPRIVEMARHGIRILQVKDPEGNTIQLTSALE